LEISESESLSKERRNLKMGFTQKWTHRPRKKSDADADVDVDVGDDDVDVDEVVSMRTMSIVLFIYTQLVVSHIYTSSFNSEVEEETLFESRTVPTIENVEIEQKDERSAR